VLQSDMPNHFVYYKLWENRQDDLVDGLAVTVRVIWISVKWTYCVILILVYEINLLRTLVVHSSFLYLIFTG